MAEYVVVYFFQMEVMEGTFVFFKLGVEERWLIHLSFGGDWRGMLVFKTVFTILDWS